MATASPGFGPVSIYRERTAGVAHRSAVTAADKVASPGTITPTDVTSGGVLLANTTYRAAAAAYNRYGTTLPSAVASVTTANDGNNTHVLRAAFAAVTGADGYDIFMSTAVAPLWVARITEAQRASGIVVSAVGTLIAGGAAGAVDVTLQGTGVATTAVPYTYSTAYRPDTPTPVDCLMYERVNLELVLAVTDLRSAPTLRVVAFWKQSTDGYFIQGDMYDIAMLTSNGTSLRRRLDIERAAGSSGFVLLVDAISGQGASLTAYVNIGM